MVFPVFEKLRNLIILDIPNMVINIPLPMDMNMPLTIPTFGFITCIDPPKIIRIPLIINIIDTKSEFSLDITKDIINIDTAVPPKIIPRSSEVNGRNPSVSILFNKTSIPYIDSKIIAAITSILAGMKLNLCSNFLPIYIYEQDAYKIS